MKPLILVGVGSFLGGVARYLVGKSIQENFLSRFPYGTFGVNVIGCLAIGVILGIAHKGGLTQDWKLFLASGLCGGFTTFSAFSNDTLNLLQGGRVWAAMLYAVGSVVLGVTATFIGYAIVKVLSIS